MVGLSINESTRTAASDGALSFSILVNNQRELTLSSAHSAVTGLLSAIRTAPEDFAKLLDAAADAVATQETAALKLVQPPWAPASQQTTEAIRAQLNAAFAQLLANARNQATQARDSAASTAAGAADPSTERTLATEARDAGDLLLTALSQLETGDDAAGLASLESARAQATTTLSNATAHLNSLQGMNPLPVDEIAATQAVIASASSIIDAANDIQGSTLTRPAGETATTFELTSATPPNTYVTVYGSSGAFALTDASGQGVLITSDGKVDTLPPGGDGWQFTTDSTFLLPDGTKVSVDPGSPASVLLTRGQQRITIDSLQPGTTPSVQQHASGGLAADKNRNDGYVFVMGGDARSWTLAGAALGDTAGSREVVATTPLTNEVPVDVTKSNLPPELVSFLTAYGLDPASFDLDGDGDYSNEELRELVEALNSAVGGVQLQFDNAISNTAAALQSLLKLNQFIEKILDEADKRQANRRQLTAEERDQLLVIQNDLSAALAALRSEGASRKEGANPVLAALSVLEQLGPTEPVSSPSSQRDPAPNTLSERGPSAPNQPSPAPGLVAPPPVPAPVPPPDSTSLALAQSLRRAERLLSGFSGGPTNLRFLEPLPVAPATTGTATGPASETPLSVEGLEAEPLPLPPSVESEPVVPPLGVDPSDPSDAPPVPQGDTIRSVPRSLSGPPGSNRQDVPASTPFPGRDTVSETRNPENARAPETEDSPTDLPTGSLNRPVAKPRAVSEIKRPVNERVPLEPTSPFPNSQPVPPAPSQKTPESTPLNAPFLSQSGGPVDAEPVAFTDPIEEGAPGVPSRPAPTDSSGPPGGDDAVLPRAPSPPKIEIVPPQLWPNERPIEEGTETSPPPVRTPDGRPVLPGSRFAATGPDPLTGPDPTSGSTRGSSHEYGRRLETYRANYTAQVQQSRQLQAEVRQVVERFLVLVGQDEQLRQVFSTQDLSDEQRDTFKNKVESLERELGVTWGGDPEKTPQAETKLSSRILTSGMMI